MPYQAEYIWIDGTEPSPLLRSKTKIVADDQEPGIWGFDGSSTNQALGHDSDCVLRADYDGSFSFEREFLECHKSYEVEPGSQLGICGMTPVGISPPARPPPSMAMSSPLI